jgi:hypothetical protein
MSDELPAEMYSAQLGEARKEGDDAVTRAQQLAARLEVVYAAQAILNPETRSSRSRGRTPKKVDQDRDG